MCAYDGGVREQRIEYHADGSIRARGDVADGVLDGYWEWFRKDGTRLRSGFFRGGEQAGEWVTYDRQGHVYKTTRMGRTATAPRAS